MTVSRSWRRGTAVAIVVALTLLAGGLRFWGLAFGLPHLTARPDEEVILQRTELPARGVFDLQWGTYPSGFLYATWLWGAGAVKVAQALGRLPPGSYVEVLHARPDAVLFLDRTAAALAGTATVPLVVAVARPALGFPAAAAAGLLVATSFLHVRDSHTIKPDALLSLAMLAAVAAIVPLARRATAARGALAGLCVGLATAVKYPGVLLAVPVYVAAVLGSARRGWRRVVPLAAIVAGATTVAVFFATSPDLLWNPRSLRDAIGIVSLTFARVPEGASAATTAPFEEALAAGYPDYTTRPWWDGYVRYWSLSLRYGTGLAAACLAPLAVVWGLAAGGVLPRIAAVAALAYYLMIGSAVATQSRYMTAIVPILALLEAGMLAALARRLLSSRAMATAALAVAVAAVAVEPLASAVAHDRIAAESDTRVLATRWLAEHATAGQTVAVLGSRFWPWGAPRMPPGVHGTLLPPTPEAFAAAHVSWLVTHDHPLFSSHVDPAALAALAPRLRLVTEFDPFRPGRAAEAVFEPTDAYYIPMHGFDAVTRPGPHIRIYAYG